MQANPTFQNLDKSFWANVRSLSELLGYTDRTTKQIKTHTITQMAQALVKSGLRADHILTEDTPTPLGEILKKYFEYRASVLNTYVEPRLMDASKAAQVFNDLQYRLNSNLPIPLNKQSGDKKAPAYLTGIVQMLIEAHADGLPCDYDPRRLTSITRNGTPLRTLARRLDGCFPSVINPIAIWEIKEYYYTTTFGSRVADGVYETLLDGLELEELEEHTGINVQHLLMVDSHYTWWQLGRSYLCRLIDLLHMGYVDEILFGYEVVERLPTIVGKWVEIARKRGL